MLFCWLRNEIGSGCKQRSIWNSPYRSSYHIYFSCKSLSFLDVLFERSNYKWVGVRLGGGGTCLKPCSFLLIPVQYLCRSVQAPRGHVWEAPVMKIKGQRGDVNAIVCASLHWFKAKWSAMNWRAHKVERMSVWIWCRSKKCPGLILTARHISFSLDCHLHHWVMHKLSVGQHRLHLSVLCSMQLTTNRRRLSKLIK